MKMTPLMTLGAVIGTCLFASAQDATPQPNSTQRPNHPNHQPSAEVLKQFDKDGDGQLSADEKKAMMESMKAKMEERRKELLAKYDTDKDGKLSPEEIAKLRADRQAEMIKKYDKDGDGKLSPEESAAMPKRPPGPGGRRGPGAPDAPATPPAAAPATPPATPPAQ